MGFLSTKLNNESLRWLFVINLKTQQKLSLIKELMEQKI